MLVDLLLFPFGLFIVAIIGAVSGWQIMSKVGETENTRIDVACVFAVMAFVVWFFAMMTLQNPSLGEVLIALILVGLTGPIVGGAFYILLSAGYHFRQFRLKLWKKLTGRG